MPPGELTGARVTVRRALTWAETDASGHSHFSAAVRWLEETEHELWRRLGHVEMVPTVPRVHVELSYHERIWFGDEVDVTVGVIRLGRTSCTFGYDVVGVPSGVRLQSGQWTVVHAPDPQAGGQPWPDDVRALLDSAG